MGYEEYIYGTGNKTGLVGHAQWQLVERATLSTTTAMETWTFYVSSTNTSTVVRAVTFTYDTTTSLGDLSRAVRDS